MPSVVLGVNPAVFPVPSGVATRFMVHYQSTQAGTIELRCSGAFAVEPTSAQLAPAADGATVPVTLTISRADPHSRVACDLVATFFDTRAHCLFEVS
jgi:hypothetical protein